MRGVKPFRHFEGMLLIIVLVLCPLPELHADHQGLLNENEIRSIVNRMGSSTGKSFAPILAYEPTFGTIYGAALFLERPFAPRYSLMTRLAFSTEGEYSALVDFRRGLGSGADYNFRVEVDDFARPYYGEGTLTDPEDRIQLEGTVSSSYFFIKLMELGKLSIGPFLEYRGADLSEVEGYGAAVPEYEENTLGIGGRFYYDARNNRLSPTSGVFDTLTLRYVPESLSSFREARDFFQAEVDHRIFYAPAEGTVLAGRIHMAYSWGNPSYQYRYFLGGPYELRGFYTNRFRGEKFYTVQGEVRQDLFWIFSGAAFAEVGEVTDGGFGSPETSYGGGLRMTLPPDHVAKARLDFAWANDQHSIYFIFGEAF